MKKTIIALVTLLALGLGVYVWMNHTEPVPEPLRGETGEILSDPANEVRAEFLAPAPDSVTFD